MLVHDLLNLVAMLLSGVLGSLLVTPAQRTLAVARRRIDERRVRRSSR
jgi:hypothetical protein